MKRRRKEFFFKKISILFLPRNFLALNILHHKSVVVMSYNLLKGKKGIIFGALDEKSIAWKTALACHAEGAEILLTNAPVAMRMGEINKLAEKIDAPVIACDVSSNDDMLNLLTKAKEHFGGGVDFILHSIGMSLNVRKGKHY